MDSEEGESVVESDCNCERDEFGLAPYNSKHTTYNKKLYRIANNAKFNREIATQTAHDQTYTIIPDANKITNTQTNTQTKRRVLLPTPNTPPLTTNSQINNTNKQQTTRTTTQTNSTNKQNKPICIYYQQGRCDYNERCFNRHVWLNNIHTTNKYTFHHIIHNKQTKETINKHTKHNKQIKTKPSGKNTEKHTTKWEKNIENNKETKTQKVSKNTSQQINQVITKNKKK